MRKDYSVIHLYLYRNMIKFSRRKRYVDIEDMVYILKRMLHSLPRSFYFDLMKEMEEMGFIKKINHNRIKGIKFIVLMDKVNCLKKKKLNDFILADDSFAFH